MSQLLHKGRRRFVKFCASAAAMVGANPQVLAQPSAELKYYQRVQLVDIDGQPIDADELAVGESFIFHYPFISTPCFLLNLGAPVTETPILTTVDGQRYQWQGGVGPTRSVVAFSAICAHRMSHPTHSVSFINYRHQTAKFINADKKLAAREKVIFCCSEKSVYDPTRGATVIGGPAPQPLAAIRLDYERHDGLYAVGVYGGEMFQQFFAKFSHRLLLEYKTEQLTQLTLNTATVVKLTDFCRRPVLC